MAKSIDNIIYYSVALREFEELDFINDSLAGVRACYFEGGCKTQQQEVIRSFEEEEYDYCYHLQSDKPMLWKVQKNGELLQASKYLPDNTYSIHYYNNKGLPTKKVYFNKKHYWTKSEYFIPENGGDCVCSVAPKVINGYFALIKTTYSEGGCVASPLYMLTNPPESSQCMAVAYSDKGMLYFTAEAPADTEEYTQESSGGFTFTPVDFNLARNLNKTFDVSSAPYLTDTNGNPYTPAEEGEREIFSNSSDIPSAVDDSQKDSEDEQSQHQSGDAQDDEISKEISQNEQMENSTEELTPDYDFSEDEDINIYHSEDFNLTKSEYTASGEKPASDKTINDSGQSFLYYGALDESGRRSGYGRTETTRGKTAYEGGYKDDMRDGFGTFYYKDGSVNYIGDWHLNKRRGRGVGFRSSDGEIHVGKWNENLPQDLGARFDKDGNFLSLNHYNRGNKDGIGISFDSSGNLVVSKWSNNRLTESKIILLSDDEQ